MKRQSCIESLDLPRPKRERIDLGEEEMSVADADAIDSPYTTTESPSRETYLALPELQQPFGDVLYTQMTASSMHSLYRTCKYMYNEDEYMQCVFGPLKGKTVKDVLRKVNYKKDITAADLDRLSYVIYICPSVFGYDQYPATFPLYIPNLVKGGHIMGNTNFHRRGYARSVNQKCPCRWLVYNGFIRLLDALWNYWELERKNERCPFQANCRHAPCNRGDIYARVAFKNSNIRVRTDVEVLKSPQDPRLMCDAVMSGDYRVVEFVSKHTDMRSRFSMQPEYYEFAITTGNFKLFKRLTKIKHWDPVLKERMFRIDGKYFESLWLSHCIAVTWWEKKGLRHELAKILSYIRHWEWGDQFVWNEETEERCKNDLVDVGFYIATNAHCGDKACSYYDFRTNPNSCSRVDAYPLRERDAFLVNPGPTRLK